jgi:hypothetical protein
MAQSKAKRDLETRRKEAKPKKGKETPLIVKEKRTVSLSPLASLRLDTYALGSGKDMCEVIEDLILAYCTRYELRDLGEERDWPRDGAGEGMGTMPGTVPDVAA